MQTTNYLKKYNIYDIFYNGYELVLVSPMENRPYDIQYNGNKLVIEKCSHGLTYIYHIDMDSYKPEICLEINGEKIFTKVNKYQSFPNEIIMATCVKNEDNYILQWINYHKNLGITRFIIYDNCLGDDKGRSWCSKERTSNLSILLKELIDNNVVILINWPYPKRGPSGRINGQTTQQNHSIYAFRDCKYIGLFDIDEYVNIQEPYNTIDQLFSSLDNKNMGGFKLLCKLFYNPNNKKCDGYDFLKIPNCGKILKNERAKNFVIPKNVKTFAIHTVTNGEYTIVVDEKLCYFNHYFYLNKNNRGLDLTDFEDTTINRLSFF